MSSSVKIVRAKPNDKARIWSLLRMVVFDMNKRGLHHWRPSMYPTQSMVEDDIRKKTLYIINMQPASGIGPADIVGVFTLDTEKPPEYLEVKWLTPDGNSVYVHRLAVAPEWQGKGVASKAMDYIEKKAKNEAMISVRLDTYSHNPPGLKLYRSRGYKETGLFTLDGWPEVFVCFELILD